MITSKIIRQITVAVVLIVLVTAVNAAIADECIFDDIIKKLGSSKFVERANALSMLSTKGDMCPFTEELSDAVIKVAEKDMGSQESGLYGEVSEGFFVDIVIALGNTRMDIAAKYIVEHHNSFEDSREALVKIGEPSVKYLLKGLHNINTYDRVANARALGHFLERQQGKFTAEGELRAKIKKALIDTLKSKESENPHKDVEYYQHKAQARADLRMTIIRALGRLAEEGDAEAMEIIEKTASEDPFEVDHSHQKDWTGPQKTYLVRDEAQKVLDRIKGAKPEKPAITNQPSQ